MSSESINNTILSTPATAKFLININITAELQAQLKPTKEHKIEQNNNIQSLKYIQ